MGVKDARIAVENGRRYWTCPTCGRKLGEVSDGVVIIKAGQRFLMIRLDNDQLQRCPVPTCGTDSVLYVDRVVA